MGIWTAGLVVSVAVAVKLLADLPTLTISEGEVYTVPLADYFQGNNVNFTLLGGAQSVPMPSVENPLTLNLMQEFPYDEVYKGPSGTLGGQMKVLNQQGETFVLNSYNNVLQSFVLYYDGVTQWLWNLTIQLKYEQPVIQKMCNLTGLETNELFVLVTSVETIGEWEFSRNDIFLLNISDLRTAPQEPFNLDLEDIRYFTTVDMEAIYADPYGYERILVTSCTEVRSPTQSNNYLIFYNVTNAEDVQFMQQVISYGDIVGYTGDVPLHTIGFAYFQQTLYILDQGVGLFTFNFVGDFFLSSDFVDILRFGTPVSICAPTGDTGYLVVGTVGGLVLINSNGNSLTEYMWIPTNLANGNPWVPLSSHSNGRYIFTNSQQSLQTSFLIIDITQPFNCYIQRQWYFSAFIPADSYLINAPFILAQQLDPTILYLFRSDKDALRLFEVRVGPWVIEGTALESEQYSAQVLAVDLMNPLDTAISDLHVNYLQLNDTSILLGSGYTLSPALPLSLSFTPDITGNTSLVSLPISQLCSGPGLLFSLSFLNIPEGVTLRYASQFKKLSLVSNLELELDTGNLAAMSDGYAYIFADSSVYIYNFINETMQTYTIVRLGDYEGNYLAVANNYLYVLATNTITGELTLIGKSLDGQWSYIALSTPKDCFKVKSLFAYIVCVSPGEITLYDLNLIVIGSVNAYRMGVKAIEIVDISGQVTDYTQRSIMYVSCRINGLIGVDITYIQYFEILGNFVCLASATKGVYLLSMEDTLAQANRDGSVLIINVENAPNIQLVRTLPSWSSDSLQEVRHIAGFIVAQHGSTLYFYDFLTAVHSSLYYSMPLDPSCQFAGSGTNLVLFCPTVQGSALLQYQPPGFPTPTGFVYSYNITVTIDMQQFLQDCKPLNGTLTVSNEAGNEVQVQVSLELEAQGHVVFLNLSALQHVAVVPYTQEAVIDLDTIFSGQNLKLYLNINGTYPLFTPNSSFTNPISLAPSLDITSQYHFPPYTDFAYSVLLLPNNLTILLTDELVQIYLVQTAPGSDWLEPQNASLLAEFDFPTLANDSSIHTCALQVLAFYDPTRALIGFYCSGEMLLDSGQTLYDALILANLDLNTLNFTVAYRTFLAFPPLVFKAKSDSAQRFVYMLLIDSMTGTASCNHLIWYMFRVTSDGLVSMEGNFTIVDFFMLRLPILCVQDADIYLRPYGGFIYIADVCYGVRIVRFTVSGDKYTLSYVGSVETAGLEDPITSISACNGVLYALTQSGLLGRYNLSAPANLVEIEPVQRYNPIGRNYTALPATLTCIPGSSKQPESFLLGLLDTGMGVAYIRIYDLQASLDSAILRDVVLTQAVWAVYQPISALPGGSFVSLSSKEGFQVWMLRHPYLLVPALSADNYTAMKEKWGGTNFSLFLTAENDQMAINSTVFFLSRINATSPANPESGDSGSSSPYWWVWLLVAIAVVLAFIGISVAVRVYQRRQKELDSEGVSPSLPINEQIDAYY